ncbi:DNA polymerase III, alpha chain [Halobacteroides halobius DSM 5150]|uniref:DNA polymerase III PolC-type n=1 Tax=Halobacteroides halobius (strain ATCC 35273 / DSM 5150 / MD-1) TaxID=748449 RepID=L0K978_HALHC|nr:PolC-type DNA polymerase III [Halobacteroides halobius]AGB40673.1 DNA polymerase III, alpha chain [Halobacteroides halobius DSM 5150]
MTMVNIEPDQNNPFRNELKQRLDIADKLINKIKFKKLKVDTTTNECSLQLKVPQSIEINSILEELSADFFVKGELKYQIDHYNPDLSLQTILKDDWEEIIKEIRQQSPQANGWLSLSKWNIKEGILEVEVENQTAIEALEKNKCDRILRKILDGEYNKQVKVNFVVGDFKNESNQLANEQQKETKAYMDSLVKNSAGQGPARNRNSQSTNSVKGQTVWLGKKINGEVQPLDEITGEVKNVVVKGQIFSADIRHLQSGSKLIMFDITDHTNSITVKLFENKNDNLADKVAKGEWLLVEGNVEFDTYDQELMLKPRNIMVTSNSSKKDEADQKRAELHLHTKMSSLDSVLDVEAAIKQADDWGHSAIAITDHGVVQAFPDAYNAAKDKDIKVIYGLEAYLVDDGEPIILNPVDQDISKETYIVFDLETTGFNPHHNEIIEIGAAKVEAGTITESYQTFVNPSQDIPAKITELTGINAEMVADAPSLKEAITKFLDFIGDATLVAHNLSFDLGFIEDKLRKLDKPKLTNPALDTLNLSRALLPELKSYKLNKLAKKFNKNLENHHRAYDDAKVTAEILLELIDLAKNNKVNNLTEINQLTSKIDYKRMHPYHTTILVKNQQGLRNLYQLVSEAHVENFHRVPRVLKSQLLEKREGLIIGSACEAGQLYKAILHGKSDDELIELAKFYDYLEVQPLGNNKFLLEKGEVESFKELEEINRKIYQLGNRLGKPVIAAGDVHFLDAKDSVYRRVLKEGQGFDDAADQPPLYLRTTEEMLAEFDYFSEDEAYELVIENPKDICEEIEEVEPIPDKLFTPTIEGAEDEIREMAYNKAKKWYGNPLPDLVVDRLENELESIIGNGYAVIYLISHKLVKKSLSDGYLVGSRGSVGSSFAATMTDITEVNPLPPHYRCPECKDSTFFTDGSVGLGVDLPDKDCGQCGTELIKDGYDIPFEVFLGFEGDKVPDIDLNFSGEYQSQVHRYTEKLFGEEYVYRAGTISTIADRTAYGFVKGHMEDNNLSLRQAEINRLSSGCTGVKRTTGQHPGGQIVVPQDKEIYDFTPIQRPANDMDSDTLTTHFDFHSIHDNLLKLDVLGHDDPTSIRMLQDLTGVDPQEIPLDDEETMGIFSSIEPLGVTEDQVGVKLGTLGIPEFGTQFVRGMLRETRPTTFAELVRISGLSHGADVWLNNAQDLIRSGTAKLAEVISVRDDIMNYLLQKGVEPSQAFWIMEHVRKGKGLTAEEEQAMRENNVPNWYIESCKKINYMFPKAHAAAYVMMAFRIAYFKVHHPQAFYNTFFTIKANDFDAQIVLQGEEHIKKQMQEIKSKGNDATAKDKNTRTVLEIVIEALARGIEFVPVDIYESKAYEFKITDDGLLPPLISLDGLGRSAAKSIVQVRKEGEFTSIENLKNRSGASKTVIEALRLHGSLEGLPETNQLSLFQ